MLRSLLDKASPAPWSYRPNEFDDWGFIRDANGKLVCIARTGEDYNADEHRRNKTDPYAANALLIVEMRNMIARKEGC